MANTLGTTNADVIAQRALETLVADLPIIGQIATDLSDANAKFNERVIVHEVTAAAAADFSAVTGYVPSTRTQVDIPVTINKHKHHTYSVSVTEASTSRVDLIERFAQTAAYSIGAALVADLSALVLAAAYAGKTTQALGAGADGFDRKSLIKVGLALSLRKVPAMGRWALLSPAYYASLCMDNTMLTALLQAGSQAVISGRLPNVGGFNVSEFVDLPDNGENLVGFAGVRSALALATRIPDDPGQGQSNCRISVITEPKTGLSLQVREWYNADYAAFRRTYTLMYGVAAGQGDAIQRIVSA